ncbi:hypothetical protein SAMN04490356_3590 [Streptomyces melanosporofaciens]|uniref:Uncharacterized protein n=1 Tax=Streptomyces melanosporofaciens TaxID=67327 RepID=A0A1H4RBN7_STRMJ|nr:hypothetical protein [Streptomyces melanosporofaciens]SEC29174.1 hypothetical protein SAMN04490356_3590 [Streptomyces melanosporofaciens]
MTTSTDVEPRPAEAPMGGRLRAWLLRGLSDMAKQQPGPHAQVPGGTGGSAGGG